MASNPWEILNQNRLNLPGLMEAAGQAKQRRLQEMMLNRQIEREDQQYATRIKALGQLGSGDKKAARQTATAGGDFDLIKHLDSMDEASRAQVAQRAQIVGNLAQWADNPQKWDQAIDFAVSQGYDDLAQYKGKFSPEGRMSAISLAGQTKEYMDRSKPVNMAPGGRLVDPVTGKVIAEAPFAPRTVSVSPGETVLEFQPGGGVAPPASGAVSPAQFDEIAASVVPGIVKTSGQRSPAKNAAVGGVANSYHLTGEASDYVPPTGMTMDTLAQTLRQAMPGAQVINEGDHVHVEPASRQTRGGDPASSGGGPRVVFSTPPAPEKPDKAPSGFRWTPQGTLAAIPGGPGDKKGGGPSPKDVAQLRKEFNLLPEVKEFKAVRSGYQQVKALGLKKDATGQDDMAMIFSFMKILDPTSVVREGEYALAAGAAGMPQQIVLAIKKAESGEKLSPAMRRQMVTTARTMYQQREATYNEAATMFQGFARDQGIEPTAIARRLVPPKKKAPTKGHPDDIQALLKKYGR